MEKKHFVLRVFAVFAICFIICVFSSFSLHKSMLIDTVSVTSQIACGQTAQKIIFGLSYGKEISNYRGLESLLSESIKLSPRLKNIYICDMNGMICGSYLKMINNTQLISKRIYIDEESLLDAKLHGSELHTLRALDVNGETVGYIGTVVDVKTVMRPLNKIMIKEGAILLLLCLLFSVICVLTLKFLLKHVKRKKIIGLFSVLLTIFAIVLSSCILHLNTQKIILDSEIVRQGNVMAKTINADINKIFKKGINIKEVTGFDEYLKERLYGLTALSSITIEDKITREQFVAHNANGNNTVYETEYRGLSFFDIIIGVSEEEYAKYQSDSIKILLVLLVIIEGVICIMFIKKERKQNKENRESQENKAKKTKIIN